MKEFHAQVEEKKNMRGENGITLKCMIKYEQKRSWNNIALKCMIKMYFQPNIKSLDFSSERSFFFQISNGRIVTNQMIEYWGILWHSLDLIFTMNVQRFLGH